MRCRTEGSSRAQQRSLAPLRSWPGTAEPALATGPAGDRVWMVPGLRPAGQSDADLREDRRKLLCWLDQSLALSPARGSEAARQAATVDWPAGPWAGRSELGSSAPCCYCREAVASNMALCVPSAPGPAPPPAAPPRTRRPEPSWPSSVFPPCALPRRMESTPFARSGEISPSSRAAAPPRTWQRPASTLSRREAHPSPSRAH